MVCRIKRHPAVELAALCRADVGAAAERRRAETLMRCILHRITTRTTSVPMKF